MNTSVGKILHKCVLFLILFAIIWQALTRVLDYDVDQIEHLKLRYKQYKEEQSPDVLFVGASNTFADVAPAVVWSESGITSYNLGSSNNTSMLMYYQLQYAFKQHTPKLVVVDVSGISIERDLLEHESANESMYRRMASTMPDFRIKSAIISEICKNYPNQDRLTYWFPLLRYHQRWDELFREDSNLVTAQDDYQDFRKGCHLNNTIRHQQWSVDSIIQDDQRMILYEEYLEKILTLCKNHDSKVMLVLYPKPELWYSDCVAAQRIAEKNEVPFLRFLDEKQISDIGIDFYTDYYDGTHLNLLGQEKFSRYFAHYLKKNYDFNNHNGNERLVEEWNQAYQDYMVYYKKNTKDMPIISE